MDKTNKREIKEEQKKNHFDYNLIVRIISNNSKVLDLGCGAGTLLKLLKEKKNIEARGIEIKRAHVKECIEKGLSVLHGDLDEGLKHYRDKSFDFVIFNQTIQVVRNSLLVLEEALRIGRKVIVNFPNFGHWQIRYFFCLSGRMPKSKALPYEWYNTPNIRVLTVRDFRELCKENNIHIIKEINYVNRNGNSRIVHIAPNLLATNSLFILEK